MFVGDCQHQINMRSFKLAALLVSQLMPRSKSTPLEQNDNRAAISHSSYTSAYC